MKALQYRRSVTRYLLLRTLGRRFPSLCTSSWSPLRLVDLPAPPLPGPDWVRVRPRLAGICGSDLATLSAAGSPYFSPITSMPFVLGHEVVGAVIEVGRGVKEFVEGDRVVLRPALGCVVRGIDPMCAACASGRDALCRNVTKGTIAPGIQTGYCRDTGGAFSEGLVAHRSQLRRVPTDLPDPAAVLVEPFACALHAVHRVPAPLSGTVLVIGCGSIGLLTIAALRAAGCTARIAAVARHAHQKAHASRLGAEVLLRGGRVVEERYRAWARELDADVHAAEIGKPLVIGGADITFDCVGSSASLDDGVRFTRAGGTFVVVGMPGIARGVDWTAVWYKELKVHAAYAYGPIDRPEGSRDAFDVALAWMPDWSKRLQPLVGPAFPLAKYRLAFQQALNTGRSGTVKTVFDLEAAAS